MYRKNILTFLGILSLFVLFAYGLSIFVILPPFLTLEQQELSRNLDRCQSALQAEATDLLRLTGDWAEWDDTFYFVQKTNQTYLNDNLAWAYLKEELALDALFIINAKEKIVWGDIFPSNEKSTPATAVNLGSFLTEDIVFQRALAGELVVGMIPIAQEFWILAARDIVRGSGEGPAVGVLVMGKRLSLAYLSQLSQRTKINFALAAPQAISASRAMTPLPITNDSQGSSCLLVDTDKALAYRMLTDLRNKPTAQLSLEMPRDIFQQGRNAALTSGLALCAVGLVLAFLGMKLVDKNHRLAQIKADLADSLAAKTCALQAYEISEAERSTLDLKLQQKYKMEAIGTMAGGIAHDFNNILAIIIGNANLIQHKLPADSRCQKNLVNLLTATHRATELVKQILAYSRQEKPQLRSCNLSQTMDESLNFLRATLPTSISLQKDLDREDRQLWIQADTTQLQQILINLCTNAIHAMEKTGTLTVSLHAETLKAGDLPAPYHLACGAFAHLAVADTGKGINPENLGKIFDPFFTTKGPTEGSGMGLSVVQGIVENHSGMIRVESEPGQGAGFHLYFPCCEPMMLAAKETLPVPQAGQGHILLVDDEPMLVSASCEILEQLGYKVTAETSSIHALARFRSNPSQFDLVISDNTMPELSGMELAHEIRTIAATIPIILCSGYYGTGSQQELANQEINAFCSKPLDMQQLAQTINQILEPKPPV